MKNKIYLLIAFSLYLLPGKAQQLSFNLPFVNDSAEPESYILDPNYNKKGEVDYYSLADIMKVQYTYDDQRRPVRKILYIMGKHDRKWEQTLITDFIYKDNRLVSEQTTQLYSGITPIYKLSKNTIYDPVNHTDTTRTELEWIDKRFEGRMGVFADETYTIRYLNKYNLPDSSVNIFSRDDYVYTMKQDYVYNKNQQLVNCLFYRKYTDPVQDTPWEKVGEYTIAYDKNKTEYTQTIKAIPDIEDQYLGETDPEEYKKKLKDIPLKYTISTNDDGRIIKRQLVSEGQVIMNSQYVYNEKGQMDVKQEFNLTDRFLHFYGMSRMASGLGDITKEIRNLQYTVKYQENCKQSVFNLGKKKAMEINTCLYPDNRIQSIEMIRYDDGEIDDHDKDEYKYLTNGFIERIEHSDYSEILKPRRKYLYKEDAQGRVLHNEEFSYNSQSKQWEAEEKEINKYDQYGYKCYSETYKYRQSYEGYYGEPKAGEWEGKTWNEYVYDARKRVLEQKTKQWSDGQWVNRKLIQAAYGDDDREILDVTYEWDDEGKYWVGVRKDSIFFDDTKFLTGRIKYQWLEDKRVWEFYRKTETVFQEDQEAYRKPYGKEFFKKEKMTYYNWNNGRWEPDVQRVENKRRGGFFHSYSKWNTEKQDWIIERKEIQETDENGTELVEEYCWNDELGELVGEENTTTLYLDANDRNSKRIIYRGWDRLSRNWKDKVACNAFAIDNNEAYIYERYDEKNNRWVYGRKAEAKALAKDQMEVCQYFWSEKINNWEPDRKILSYSKNNSPFRNEVFVYDKTKKQWVPLYCMNKTTSGNETIFYKWSEQQQKWVHYLARKGGSWDEKTYLWDEKINKFVEVEYYKFRILRSEVEEAFSKIEMDTRYSRVMGD